MDHYQCYDVEDGPFSPVNVQLVDQFGATRNVVAEPRYLCAPVDKNKEGVNDKDNHLVCYLLAIDTPANVRVEVTNQFGTQQFLVGDRRLLCVPSTKKLVPDQGQPEDHFQCYRTDEHGQFRARSVKLADQFSKDSWEDWLISVPIFCNPADKNGEGINDEKRHLTCYALEKQHPAEVNVHVVVSDQFGKHELLVGKALVLCVPSLKDVPPSWPRPPVDVKGNHYTCYDVKDFEGKFDPRSVTIKDQFGGTEALVVEVQALCTPADKNGGGIENKEAHLLCYRLEKGQEARLDISANNQFGSELLWIRDAIALCVPSTKEVI